MVHLRKLHSIPIIVVCIVSISVLTILACYFNREKLIDILNTYKLIPVPNRYTELYLDDHDSLPIVIDPEQVATASFTILNKEGATESYRYLVRSNDETEENVIASGNATLKHDAMISIPFSFSVATTEPKTKIEIILENKNQSVHFWVNNL